MSDTAIQPGFPTGGHSTREQAITAAFMEMWADGEPDPVVYVHGAMCAVRFEGDCDCGPEIISGREVRA